MRLLRRSSGVTVTVALALAACGTSWTNVSIGHASGSQISAELESIGHPDYAGHFALNVRGVVASKGVSITGAPDPIEGEFVRLLVADLDGDGDEDAVAHFSRPSATGGLEAVIHVWRQRRTASGFSLDARRELPSPGQGTGILDMVDGRLRFRAGGPPYDAAAERRFDAAAGAWTTGAD